MKIAQVAPLIYDIPPEKYGGVELVIYYLINGLKEKGHTITLFTTEDSKVEIEKVTITKKLAGKDIKTIKKFEFIEAAEVIKRQEEFDIVHIHYYPFSQQWIFTLGLLEIPFLFTLHSVLDLKGLKKLFNLFPYLYKVPLVSISNAQRESLPQANYVGTVYNGIDVSLYPFEKNKEDFLVFIGRLGFEKGLAEAIKVSKKLGKKLYILAKCLDPTEIEYFEKYVKPELNNNIIYVGEVDFKEKVEYLKKACAFIFPIQWREPFGLVMIEAMACGTPVFAPKRGAAPEIIVHGKTGALVPARKNPRFMDEDLIENLIKAFKKYIDKLSPEDCRKHVEENFNHIKMTENYLKVYQQVVANWETLKPYFDPKKIENLLYIYNSIKKIKSTFLH